MTDLALRMPAASDQPKAANLIATVSRWLAAFEDWTARSSDDEIGAYIARNGGVFTDELEREIGRRFGGMVR